MAKHTQVLGCVLFVLCLNLTLQVSARLSLKQLHRRYGDALEAIFGIGVRLQVLLEDPEMSNTSNFLISPLSVALMVSQLMIGADEEFRDELYNLLSLPDGDDNKNSIIYYYGRPKNISFTIPYGKLHSQMGTLLRTLEGKKSSRSFILNCSTALFTNSDLNLTDTFKHNLQIYETNLQTLNFSTDPAGSQKSINEWAASHTNNMIDEILVAPLPSTTSALFTNAIYFLADWKTPFSYQLNLRSVFNSAKDKQVPVEYMRGTFEDVLYAESSELGAKLLMFPYKDKEVSMYFVLPNEKDGEEYDIKNFAENMTVDKTLKFIKQVKPHTVAVQIPKMKLSCSISILEPLQRYRIYMQHFGNQTSVDNEMDVLDILEERINLFSTFNTTARMNILLKEATEGKELQITDILQQTTLTIDEKGTEAAAISASVMDYIGGNKLFKLTRPFLFFIRHEPTEAVLFWGSIVDPSQTA